MRERLEDLGRIAVLLDEALDMGVWTTKAATDCRNKEIDSEFFTWNRATQEMLLRDLFYGLDDLRDKIIEISDIAYGEDTLNQEEE